MDEYLSIIRNNIGQRINIYNMTRLNDPWFHYDIKLYDSIQKEYCLEGLLNHWIYYISQGVCKLFYPLILK